MFKFNRLNKKIDRIYEKYLRLILNNHQSTLDEMAETLNEKESLSIPTDPQVTEVYKFLNDFSPDIMNDVFHRRQNTYSLQNFHVFGNDIPRSNYLLNSVVYRAKQLWNTLLFNLKNTYSLTLFKRD